MGVIFKNENVNEDMLGILKLFQSYLPSKEDEKVDGQIFTGDQLMLLPQCQMATHHRPFRRNKSSARRLVCSIENYNGEAGR